MASSNKIIATFVVVVTLTGGICFWIGAVLGYGTGQRTAQYHLRAKILTEVEKCWVKPRLEALACRFRTVMGPSGLNLPRPPKLKRAPEKFKLPEIKPVKNVKRTGPGE